MMTDAPIKPNGTLYAAGQHSSDGPNPVRSAISLSDVRPEGSRFAGKASDLLLKQPNP
jgi:hypothetical protein